MTRERDTPSGQSFVAPPLGDLTSFLDITNLPSPYLVDGAIFEGARAPDFNDEGNRNGFETEQRVGNLLIALPYVTRVRQAELYGAEDADLTDLVVDMIDGFAVSSVKVQVKSSSAGNEEFYQKVARRMKKEGKLKGKMGEESHEEKKRWMNARRLVLINGGFKDGERVIDEYVVQKFISQVAGIVDYEREEQSKQLVLYIGDLADIE